MGIKMITTCGRLEKVERIIQRTTTNWNLFKMETLFGSNMWSLAL
jgi:hypothetical protein